MLRPNRQGPALAKATCAALIAASFAVGSPLDAESIQSIEQYCQSSWRQAGIPQAEWEDCTQDTMLELFSRLPQQRDVGRAIAKAHSSERRQLMRSVWCVAQRWRRRLQRAPVSLELVPESGERQVHFEDQLANAELLQRGFEHLNDTQRSILGLWCEGHSVAEIAEHLRLPAARVSDQKYKAIKVLKSVFTRDNQAA